MSGFDFGEITRNLGYLFLDGMRFTLLLTVLAASGGIVLGTALALLRLFGGCLLGGVVARFVNLVRAMPLVLVIFWFYFLGPYVGQWVTGAPRPMQVGAFASALLTFTVYEAVYFSEIVRAGLLAMPRGQSFAAMALGLTRRQALRDVILPQVFRVMLPVLLTQTIVLFQDTSLVYVISLTDFLGAASKAAQRDGRLVELYTFAAVIYFVVSFTASRAAARLQAQIVIPR